MQQEAVLQGSTIRVCSGDNVAIKQLWKFAVPTAWELSRVLDLLPDYSLMKVALGLVACQGVRCSELCDIRWSDFFFDEKQERIIAHKHRVYKPTNHRKEVQQEGAGRNIWFKEVRKPIWSKWLSDQLIGYARRQPRYAGNRLFPWADGEPLRCWFKRLRSQVKKGELVGYEFLLDKTGEVVEGSPKIQFRFNPYSLRRFSMSFHYWMTFSQNIVLTSKTFGHSKVETTYQHYIVPYAAIGLDEKMMAERVTLDEFVHVRGQKQMRIIEFLPDWHKRFVPVGQTTLSMWE